MSRVLNGAPPTRERVRRAVEALGYRGNAWARSLSLGRSHTVGVIVPLFTTPSVVERLRGVAASLAQGGYDLLLFGVDAIEQRVAVLRDFDERDRVDGLLVISLPLSDHEVNALRRDTLPLVLVDSSHRAVPHVVVDDVRGGELAAEHLLAKGHRRIGFIGDLPSDPLAFTWSEHRRRGFRRALQRAGLNPAPDLEQRGPYGHEQAKALAEALLDRDDPPTAIFAASDIQAVGVLQAAESRGLRVPDDLAVIGFDDVEIAQMIGLTTVRQPLWETGARGAELLLSIIDSGDREPIEIVDALTVVQRRTT